MMILTFKDGSEINNVTSESTVNAIVVEWEQVEGVTIADALASYQPMFEKRGNLDHFELMEENGDVVGEYENYKYVSTSYTVNEDGTYHVTFFIEPKSETEIRLDKLQEEQELQNGAIDELAMILGGEE